MQVEEKTVSTLVLEIPGAIRIFEELGIDYCCGGGHSLEEACARKGVDVTGVVRSLEQAMESTSPDPEAKDWTQESLRTLIDHIVDKHHRFTRNQLHLLEPLASKVVSVHGGSHPELREVQQLFGDLEEELSAHMMKEERILFPHISQMESRKEQGMSPPPAGFGTVQNPIRMMVGEHDAAGELLEGIRQATSDFSLPEEACTSYRVLFQELQMLEKDLHRHIHLENNLLFPRAIALENQFLAQAPGGGARGSVA